MSELCIITDTHFGVRGDSPQFLDYFIKFYDNIFFPTLYKRGIKKIYHLGDLVDKRKNISFVTSSIMRKHFFERALELGIDITIIPGNHDVYFKNTNRINSLNELAFGYSNVEILNDPIEKDGYAFIPWICDENKESIFEFIKNTRCDILMGHLELQGFQMYRGKISDHGLDASIFSKFDKVFTGHFHSRSTSKNIYYLGAPYENTWADYEDPKGFHIFDEKTKDLTFVENEFTIFAKVYYDEDKINLKEFDYKKYSHQYIKLIVYNKKDQIKFEKFIEQLEILGAYEIQIIEDKFSLTLGINEQEDLNAEDTLSVIKTYVEKSEGLFGVDKLKVDILLEQLFKEASMVEMI